MLVIWYTHDLARIVQFEGLQNVYFWCHFHMSCVLAFVQAFSVMLSVRYNRALTTAVIETLTRIILCFLEILIVSSTEITWMDYLGLGISILGNFMYTYL